MTTLPAHIDYQFKNKALLVRALTHSSAVGSADNERLEFLGDRVLGLVVAEMLYNEFPNEAEGDLALRHAALVRASTLADIARQMKLATHLTMGEKNNEPGDNVLSDALEALFGAIYLDGGFQAAASIVASLYAGRVTAMQNPPQDPKTALQEWAQARGLPVPDYTIIDRSGPDHAPHFKIQVSVQGLDPAQGAGTSRKIAEKEAAQNMLATLKS